jgi:hypothetical protein
VLNYCIDRGSYTGCDLPIDCMSLTLDDSVWGICSIFSWWVSY